MISTAYLNNTHIPEVLESLKAPSLMTQTPFSYAFFSTLAPGAKIAAHTGPCNLRIRCHLPLIVPEGDCGMTVGGKTVKWEEGSPLFFDDCYEHHGAYSNVPVWFSTLLLDVTLCSIWSFADPFRWSNLLDSIITTTDNASYRVLSIAEVALPYPIPDTYLILPEIMKSTIIYTVWNNTNQDRVVLLLDLW
jgi:hypothetical protein